MLLDGAAPLLTLIGPGGVGKTRLALEIANDLAESFADGVDFAELSSIRDPDLVLPTIAQALGVREAGEQSLVDRLVVALKASQRLLVLDNFEQVLDASPAISSLLEACPALQVLVTSRAPLRVRGEHLLPVEPLAVPAVMAGPHGSVGAIAEVASVDLFVQRARAVDPGFDLSGGYAVAVAEICRRVDGLPLAIELAATKIRLLPPDALLSRLDRRLPLLTGGVRGEPTRLRTMRDAIAWSYDLLTPADQAIFRRLAVFAGGFTLDAVGAVAGDPADGAGELLSGIETLVNQSLIYRLGGKENALSRGGPRFGMYETIREFAGELLEASGEDEVMRERQAAWCLEFVTQWDPLGAQAWQSQWIELAEAELPNARVALDWLLRSDQAESALRMASGLHHTWWTRSRLSEAIESFDRVLASGAGTLRSRALALVSSGAFKWASGDDAGAEAALRESRRLAEANGDDDIAAYAGYYYGEVAEYAGNQREATARYEDGLLFARRQTNPLVTGMVLENLGGAYYHLGDLRQAVDLTEEALGLLRAAGSPRHIAIALTTLGWIHIRRGDPDGAARHFEEALRTAIDLADAWWVGNGLMGFAGVAMAVGDPHRAGRLLGAAYVQLALTGRQVLPFEFQHREMLPDVRVALGEDGFTQAIAVGSSLSLETALADAHGHRVELPHPGSGVAAPPRSPDEMRSEGQRRDFGLTPTERKVLALMVQRWSYPEIATMLSRSPRTVEGHATSIFNKLGVSARRDAAALAAREGLV